MTIELREGVKYQQRDGDGPVTVRWAPCGDGYNWLANGVVRSYTDKGHWRGEGFTHEYDLVAEWVETPEWTAGPPPSDIPSGKVAEVQHRIVDAPPVVYSIRYERNIGGVYRGHTSSSHNAQITMAFLPDGTPDWPNCKIEAVK